jgi:hypothetical protein
MQGYKRRQSIKDWTILFSVIFTIIGAATYYVVFFTPKNSLELYQAITFADDFEEVKKLMLKEYEGNFKKEDFEYITSLAKPAKKVSQFTLFEYDEKTFVIMTSPGTERLKVLSVEELPKEIRDYFLELEP